MLVLVAAGHVQAQQGTLVSARFASVKGVVMISTTGGGEKQAQKGDSIRAGTVITCGTTSGALLKPLPMLRVIIYPETKIRFDGADTLPGGGGNVTCSILAGKALFHIDQNARGEEGPSVPSIKVTVVTDEGVIVNKPGTESQQGGGTKKEDTKQITAATWTVQHDEGRTVVAVGEGASNVSIGKGSSAANGDVGGQVEVPKGSVIWLFNRDGKIEAELVDTMTGKVTNLTGGSSQGGSDLVEQSKKQLVTPSSSGTTETFSTPTSQPGTTTPGGSPTNPDLSTPTSPLPVVSADTP
jgi:hypothetical protein